MTGVAKVALVLLIPATLGLAVATVHAEEGIESVDLTAPEPIPAQGLSVRLKVGPLPRGAILEVMTASHELIGAVSLFGAAGARQPVDYVLPLPENLVGPRRIRLLLQVRESNGELRDPSPRELFQVELIPTS